MKLFKSKIHFINTIVLLNLKMRLNTWISSKIVFNIWLIYYLIDIIKKSQSVRSWSSGYD